MLTVSRVEPAEPLVAKLRELNLDPDTIESRAIATDKVNIQLLDAGSIL